MSLNATGSGSAIRGIVRRLPSRRSTAAIAIGVIITTVAACGSSGSSPPPSAAASSPSASASGASAAAASKVTVGSTSLQKSTLATGQPAEFRTSKAVKQTSKGLSVTVPSNGQTVTTNSDSHGIPQSFEVGVMVTPPSSSSKLLYGIGCEGDYYDFSEHYVALTDATGGWEILQVKTHQLTTLASGRTQLDGGDTQLNLVCAQLNSPDFTTRLSFAIDNKIVKTIDHTDKQFASGNSFELVVADPGTGASGSAIFHHLDVRSATAT